MKKMARTLISMRQFWIRDLDYSLTLIGQFLEDMDEYRKDLSEARMEEGEEEEEEAAEKEKTESDGAVNVKDSAAKIGALIGVLMTVLQVND